MKDARAQFGKTAAAYVSSATHASGEDLERLVAVAAPRSDERALDLGCGVGHTLHRIAPLVAFAVGADATLEMMQAGRASVPRPQLAARTPVVPPTPVSKKQEEEDLQGQVVRKGQV